MPNSIKHMIEFPIKSTLIYLLICLVISTKQVPTHSYFSLSETSGNSLLVG